MRCTVVYVVVCGRTAAIGGADITEHFFFLLFGGWKTQLAHPYLAVQASRARDIGS